MTATLLFLWAVLVQAVIGEQPEKSQLPPQIVGGHDAIPHQYPFQVSLTVKGVQICGGTLISDRWVLTAGHCLFYKGKRIPNDRIAVQLGSHFRNQTIQEETTAWVSRATYFSMTEDPHHNIWQHDLGLVRLTEPVKLIKGKIWPVKLPDNREELGDREVVTLIGWGISEVKYFTSGSAVEFCGEVVKPARNSKYQISKEIPNCGTVEYSNKNATFSPYALQHTMIPTVSRDDCYLRIANDSSLRGIKLDVKFLICVGTQQSSSCHGDSGGPMVKKVDGEWVQFGISSFGPALCRMDLGSSVYTKVSHYIKWINHIMNRDYAD